MGQMRGLLACAVAAAVATSCGQGAKGGCPALDVCGGDPAGVWTVSDVCQYSPVRPSQPVDTNDFANMTPPLAPTLTPPQPAPVQPTQSSSGDWCSSLWITPSGSVMNAALWHDAPKLIDGTMTFVEDPTNHSKSYVTKLTFSTRDFPVQRNTTHFAPRCLMANGGNPTCDTLTAGLKNFYAAPSDFVPAAFQNIACVKSADDGGCDCTYIYVVQVDDRGTYLVREDGTLLQDSTVFTYNGVQAFPQTPSRSIETKLCAAPGMSMQLSGPNGGALSGMQGLRTLVLVPKTQ